MTEDEVRRELQKRVMKGIEALDMTDPEWWRKINLPTFNIQDCSSCILGQLYMGFSNGLEVVSGRLLDEGMVNFGTRIDGDDYGFDIPNDVLDDDSNGTGFAAAWAWDVMGTTWATIIKQRQENQHG